MDYREFLAGKEIVTPSAGIDVDPATLNPMLFPFQRDIVAWALRKGRAAIFADCGLGKTPMQLSWAHEIPGKVLILAPLAVSQQTVREGKKFGIEVAYARSPVDAQITITNYEMLEHFDPADYQGIVLDESSILKSFTGKIRNDIIAACGNTPYRLACTATPAPNDYMELGNHSEFLGMLTRTEMLSTFFVHDGGDTSKWRLKRHAEKDFWKWVCSGMVMLRKPSDLGYEDDGFILPPIHYHDRIVDAQGSTDGRLFHMTASTLEERRHARQSSVKERAEEVANIVATRPGEEWLIWCNLNVEGEAARKAIADAVEVKGSDDRDEKESRVLDFIGGKVKVLVSKPSIFGYGLNLQHCRNVVFLGLSDSYEQFYQAVRRVYRFGQQREVHCYIVTAQNEGAVTENIKRKEKDAAKMAEEMVSNMHELNQKEVHGTHIRQTEVLDRRIEHGDGWEMHHNDCVEVLRAMPSDSIHYSIFSLPFASLYTYSASTRDMGNCRTHAEFDDHFKFMVSELYRVMMPGRLASFHCMNLPTSKERDGHIGITDFRGDLIRIFEDAGFWYHSEVTIWKDPVTAMHRTKALGLLHKQIVKDSCMSRQGIPDYLVTMRKPGDNPERVTGMLTDYVGEEGTGPSGATVIEYVNDETGKTEKVDLSSTDRDTRRSIEIWQRYASPVWMDINPSDTLQRLSVREEADERHICPLQLQVIQRGMQLWTNPGDLVLDPFSGIGSTGYTALQMGRRYVGAELKESYFCQSCANLKTAMQQNMPLFACVTE